MNTHNKEERKGDTMLFTADPNSNLTRLAQTYVANGQAKLQSVLQAAFEKAEIATQCGREFEQIK